MTGIETLSGVPETLLIPLAARAVAQKRYPRMGFRDAMAEEIAARLNVDFDRYAAAPSTVKGTILRSQWFDDACLAFLEAQPEPLFVSLGSGLNTMYERLRANARGRAFRWVDSDLPGVTAIRRTLLRDDARRTTIDADATDLRWADAIDRKKDQPLMIVTEGLLMYFEPDAARDLFRGVARAFAGAAPVRLAFDYASPEMVANSRRHPAIKRIKDQSVAFKWPVRHASDIAAFDSRWRIIDESNAPMAGVSAISAIFAFAYLVLTGRHLYACALAELRPERLA